MPGSGRPSPAEVRACSAALLSPQASRLCGAAHGALASPHVPAGPAPAGRLPVRLPDPRSLAGHPGLHLPAPAAPQQAAALLRSTRGQRSEQQHGEDGLNGQIRV